MYCVLLNWPQGIYQEGTFLFLEASFIFLFPDIEIEWCSACMNIEEGLLHVVRKTDCQIDISIIMIPATSKMGQKNDRLNGHCLRDYIATFHYFRIPF